MAKSTTWVLGACLCEVVTFRARLPTLWVGHCHCTMCQRAHGAAFVTWVGVRHSRLVVMNAAGALCWYKSSVGARRGFCRRCGTSLFFKSRRWPGEVHIARAVLRGDIDRLPESHGYFDTAVPWYKVCDKLAKSR